MTEALLRELAPQVLGAVVRRYGDWEMCEDAVQEALLAAALQWPRDGLPVNPKGWLITAASRRRIEMWPWLSRPPLLMSGSVSDFSGSSRVISV